MGYIRKWKYIVCYFPLEGCLREFVKRQVYFLHLVTFPGKGSRRAAAWERASFFLF